jgi:Doubled CXXCH motif (Paired_CXXCH_1)/Cytochrome c554 and c-prime
MVIGTASTVTSKEDISSNDNIILLNDNIILLNDNIISSNDNIIPKNDNIISSNDISCFHCHSTEVQQFQKSVHSDKISCVDCHGGDIAINGSLVSADAMDKSFTGVPTRVNITTLCSKCHSKTVDLYKESVHWKGLSNGRDNAASCLDCHETHNILSYKDPKSMTYQDNVSSLCAGCHENQTKMQAWYYGIETDRFDTYKKSYHYKAAILGGTGGKATGGTERSLATCPDCHENHNTKNGSDPGSAIYPANLVKTCEKEGCHYEQEALIYGGKVHEGQSVYLASTKIDLKSIVTYFYIAMIIFELCFSIGLIALGIYSQIDIKKRH